MNFVFYNRVQGLVMFPEMCGKRFDWFLDHLRSIKRVRFCEWPYSERCVLLSVALTLSPDLLETNL